MNNPTTRTILNKGPPTTVEVEEGGGHSRNKGIVTTSALDGKRRRAGGRGGGEVQLSLFELLLTAFRRSLVICTTEGGEDEIRSMEIGWPTEVRHVAHVTFDRFHGFLGLPDELEPEVPRRTPSASATVFGVSTESMQCAYDPRGKSIPTILLMLQKRLYAQGGLQAVGIFRITAENSEEEHVRDQLNRGVVPDNIDVHCLAGLIKAWFRELPNGVLDCLTPEQVMQCRSEDDYVQLVELLPSTESALLDWAINLMADVVEEEYHNKMNEHNIATVFAPNMTQMADPLNALMHAVQVMNFLRTLIQKALRERKASVEKDSAASHAGPSNEHGHRSRPPTSPKVVEEKDIEGAASATDEPALDKPPPFPEKENESADSATDESALEKPLHLPQKKLTDDVAADGTQVLPCQAISQGDQSCGPKCGHPSGAEAVLALPKPRIPMNSRRKKAIQAQSLNLDIKQPPTKFHVQSLFQTPPAAATEKPEETCASGRVNHGAERDEAGR